MIFIPRSNRLLKHRRELYFEGAGLTAVPPIAAKSTRLQFYEKLDFWVAQRFQRCDKSFLFRWALVLKSRIFQQTV